MTLFWVHVHRYGSELPIVDDGTITTCGPLSPSSRRWAMKAMVWMVLPSPWLINRIEWIILHSQIKQSIKTLHQINRLIKLMRERTKTEFERISDSTISSARIPFSCWECMMRSQFNPTIWKGFSWQLGEKKQFTVHVSTYCMGGTCLLSWQLGEKDPVHNSHIYM